MTTAAQVTLTLALVIALCVFHLVFAPWTHYHP